MSNVTAEQPGRMLVMGGTSGIGAQVVWMAAADDFHVRAFGRSADQGKMPNGAEAFAGNALETADVRAALQGIDVVVQALGVRERPAMAWEEESLFSSATQVLLPLMQDMGTTRLITVTGYGAGESRDTMSTLVRLGHDAVLGKVYADKTRQEGLIKASGLTWTLVRPTVLTDGAQSERYAVLTDPGSWHMGVISRADVAHFVVQCAKRGSHIKEAVVLA